MFKKEMYMRFVFGSLLAGLFINFFIYLSFYLSMDKFFNIQIQSIESFKKDAFQGCVKKSDKIWVYGLTYKMKNRKDTYQFPTTGKKIITLTQDIRLKNSFNSTTKATIICIYDVNTKETVSSLRPGF